MQAILPDMLRFAEASCNCLNDPKTQRRINHRLDINSGKIFQQLHRIELFHLGVLAHLNHKLEIINVENVRCSFLCIKLLEQGLQQELEWNGGEFLQHCDQILQNYLPCLVFMVIFDKQKDNLLVQESSKLILFCSQEIQQVEYPLEGWDLYSVDLAPCFLF